MALVTRISPRRLRINSKKAMLVFGASLALLLSCAPTFAQLNLGRIFGAVYDQSGGAVAGATVTVIDVDRGESHPLSTDSAGEYSASSLIPGTYTIRAEAKGFKTIERQNVMVGVGQDIRVDLTVQPGEQTQTITVTGSLPLMQTTNAQLGETIEDQQFADLPIAGRQFVKLLSYQPGVLGAANGFGVTISMHGIRGDENGNLFDGIDDNNVLVSTSGAVVGGSQVQEQSTILPQDSIDQVNLVTNAKAEYGWRPGAQISVGMKSGTNDIHGTAYAFGRDTALDARNAFLQPPLTTADDQLEQFGVSVGGPIKKDKLFYFGNYEGQRFVVGGPRNLQVPTTADIGSATSSFPDALSGIFTAGATPSALSMNLAGCSASDVASIAAAHAGKPTGAQLAPACVAANGLFGNASSSATVPFAQNNVGGSNNGIEKIDWHLNDHNSINGEDFFGDGNQAQVGNDIQNYWRGGAHGRAQLVRVVWVWTPNSRWVNEARFGYDRLHNPLFPLEGEPGNGEPNYMTQFGFDTGLPMPGSTLSDAVAPGCPQCGFPLLAISGGGGPSFSSLGAATGQKALQGTYHAVDSITWTKGNHLIKFGAEYATTGFTGIGLETNGSGSISFGASPAFPNASGLEDFLVGAPYTGSLLVGNPIRHIRYNRAAGFIQDDWRARNKITVNLGLRYEYVAPLSEANNLIGNFNAAAPFGMVQTGQPGAPSSLYHFSHDMLGPRGGIVWDPWGKGTTVVRLGGSILYNSAISLLTMLVQNAALTQIPTGFALYNPAGTNVNTAPGTITTGNLALSATTPWAVNTPLFPSPSSQPACGNGLKEVAPGNTALTNPAPCTPFGINPNFPNAHVATWTLDVQHALTNNLSFTVGYVGNRGIHIGAPIDLNQPLPGPKSGAVNGVNTTVAANYEQTQRPYYSEFPYFSRIQYFTGDEESSYNALELSLVERATKGLTFNASYTQSHGLDISGTERGFTLMNSRDPLEDWGNSANDPFTHFSLTATYDVPGRKSPGQMLEGWQVNSAIQLVGGVPFNADDTTDDFSGTGEGLDRWTLSGPAGAFNSVVGGTGTVPCYSIATGSFAKAANCTTVAAGTGNPGTLTAVANMPPACVAAAQKEPVNAAMNASTPGSSSGLLSLATVGCYLVNGVAMVPPAQGTYGGMSRDAFRAKGFREWDASVTKSWKYRERLTAQFRIEFYNLLNRTIYASPSSNLAAPTTFGQVQNTPNSSDPVIGQGGPREIQLGLKFIF